MASPLTTKSEAIRHKFDKVRTTARWAVYFTCSAMKLLLTQLSQSENQPNCMIKDDKKRYLVGGEEEIIRIYRSSWDIFFQQKKHSSLQRNAL
ncbi:hypothetical protein [Paenibacillus marinisediminis]